MNPISAISLAGINPWLAALAIVAFAVVLAIKHLAPHRIAANGAQSAFIDDLVKRVEKLEADNATLSEKLAQQAMTSEQSLNEMRRSHDNEMRIMRHRLNNERHSLDLVLELAELSPEKLASIIVRVKAARTQRDAEITTEALALGGGIL